MKGSHESLPVTQMARQPLRLFRGFGVLPIVSAAAHKILDHGDEHVVAVM